MNENRAEYWNACAYNGELYFKSGRDHESWSVPRGVLCGVDASAVDDDEDEANRRNSRDARIISKGDNMLCMFLKLTTCQ